MENLYRKLAIHFSALCEIPVTVVDTTDRKIVLTEDRADNFYCRHCPNRCNLLSTMLYGCNEAKRWNGRYVYYCPIGLVLNAISIPESDQTIIAGPMVMGEMQDTLLDMPEYVDKNQILKLQTRTAGVLHHMASILEMAVYGLQYRPNVSAYDRNLIPGEETENWETAEMFNSFPYMSQQAEELQQAVNLQQKEQARAALNQLLHYVYSPHPDQFALIRSRAIQLVYLLSGIAGDGESKESSIYRTVYVSALKQSTSLEELDISMTEVLHHFVDYTFDFSQIQHSNTIYRIMEYIKSHYSQKITLERIAAHVYLSAPHISGIFRKETGQTISEYIQFVRIEKSKLLLRQPAIAISDVASMCGFEEQSYFSRVFKKQTGISPKKYRQNAVGIMDDTAITAD